MNRRQLKKAFKQLAAVPGGRDQLLALLHEKDTRAFDDWADQPNGSARLHAIAQTVADAIDSLEDITRAIVDQDYDEALTLIALGHDSLSAHHDQLKGLL